MRKLLVLVAAISLVAGVAGTAGAATLQWDGTLTLDLGTLGTFGDTSVGVATVNNSSGGSHLNTLRPNGAGLTASGTVPVTDPESTAEIVSVRVTGAQLGIGTIGAISGGGAVTPNTIPVGGLAKVCLLVVGCSAALPLPLQQAPGFGQGVGGLATIGKAGQIRISIIQAPWQLAMGTAVTQTADGGFITKMRTGFVHGPLSGTSSTADASGVIQLITPQQVITSGVPGNSTKIALFNTLTLHFIPEPGLLLLLGSGVVGLTLLGRSRMRK